MSPRNSAGVKLQSALQNKALFDCPDAQRVRVQGNVSCKRISSLPVFFCFILPELISGEPFLA